MDGQTPASCPITIWMICNFGSSEISHLQLAETPDYCASWGGVINLHKFQKSLHRLPRRSIRFRVFSTSPH